MLCRVLLTVVVLTYLLCLLLISGLQKDDLSENVVRKLQRHNVNIVELANLNLTKECQNFSIIISPDDIGTERTDDYTTVSETYTRDTNHLTKTNNQKITDYVSDLLKLQDNKITEDTESMQQNKYNDQSTTGTENRNPHEHNVFTLRNKNDYSNLENLMNLWKTYSSNNNNILEKQMNLISQVITTRKPIINSNFNTDPVEVNIAIDRIINSLSKRKNINFQKDTDMENMAKQVSIIMTNDSKSNKHAQSRQDSLKHNMKLENILDNIQEQYKQNKPKEIVNDKNILEGVATMKIYSLDQKQNSVKNKALKYINNMLLSDETSKLNKVARDNYNFKFNEKENTQHNIIQPINDMKLQEMNYLYTKLGEQNTIYRTSSTTTTTSVPEDSIKVIVEKVRKLILADLKKDIVTMIPTTFTVITTTSTTETTTTTAKGSKTVVDVTNALNKFMKLIQVLQKKEDKIITELEKNKLIDKKGQIQIPPSLYSSNLSGKQTSVPYLNSYRNVPYQTSLNKPNFPQNVFKPKNISPITIQTNSNEVKPLSIRISKAETLIHQNIIVTTKHPLNPLLSVKVYKDNYHTGADKIYRSSREMTKVNYNSNFDKNHHRDRYDNGRPHYEPAYKERGNYANYDDQYPTGINYRTHYERLRNDNVKGYHEKLENTDSMDRESREYDNNDCCKTKVSSRQQVPLSDAKKLHDEVRFRNFLKTQQKVNDMLEKILSGKNVDYEPKSVELP